LTSSSITKETGTFTNLVVTNASLDATSITASGVEVNGEIQASTVSASSATFQSLTVTGEVTMSLSSVDFQNINASSLTVNGSAVSLEGHSHSASEISGLDAAISAATSSFALTGHTHTMSDIEDYEDNTFWVTGTANPLTWEVEFDQDFEDAVEAADAGKHIRAKLDYTGNGDYVCPWANVIYNSNGSAVGFDFHIMLDTNMLNPDQNCHPYLIRISWDSNGFDVQPYELS
jgi:hypothetical protein